MKKVLVFLCATFLVFGMVGIASAIPTAYTDFSSWSADAGATSLEDFSGESSVPFTTRDFGDFTATLINPYSGGPGYWPMITGGMLMLPARDGDSILELVFDHPINAFAFDWLNPGTEVGFFMSPVGFGVELGRFGPGGGDFFGYTDSDATFDAIHFYSDFRQGDRSLQGYIDNIRYSASASNPVPEPATMLLLGSGLIGLVGFRRKLKK